MSEWTFRLAEPADAEAFSKWTGENTQIDDADKLAATKKNNPTVLWFAVEKDGVVQVFAPFYLQMAMPHLGFNPEAEWRDRLQGMQTLIDGMSAFAVQYGIREITTLSKEAYPVAQWAVKHGFDLEPRQLLKLDLNKTLEPAEAK
jgi:hypothetical protein